ncbi:winged helix-turn-helix domain-containing protein [Nocardia sp. NPDC060249]|uniref:winged helix-turn-helix domain-containing protein n=1 Tax=Nocardia sp. NPDC060249 TaxID=3347082 RepID=UPI00365E46D0
MIEAHARTLSALADGALTAAQISERTGVSHTQVGEHLRHLAADGMVAGTTARPRLWGMTGQARGWAQTSIGRSALGA